MNDVWKPSKTCEWETPAHLFKELDEEFHFELDVCATHANAKCERHFTKADDGLKQEWRGTCWMNPPYSRELGKWVKKAYESSLDGATVVCLVPSRTHTQWWHDYAMKGEIRYIRGRLKFGDAKDEARFASAIVIFKGRTSNGRADFTC